MSEGSDPPAGSPQGYLPYGRQWIGEDDIAAVVEVLRSDFVTTGPAVRRFEDALCAYTGARRAVAVSSGTSALHAAYFAAGIGPGDEIVTSPLTFAGTANAALYLGASVRFADVEADTGNLDADRIEEALTDRTRLIVPIDYAGHPADYDGISAIARRRGLKVAADAAHSLGATYHGRPAGTLADLSATSFHPVKPMTTAEGGAVLTDDPDLADRAARFREHGIVRDPGQMQLREGPWWYEMHDLGFNYRLSAIHCALGWSQLRKLDQYLARRRAIAATYTEALAGIDRLQLPAVRDQVQPGWHLYVVRVADAVLRRPLVEALHGAGIGVQVHYIPVHYHPYYQKLGYQRGACPIAEDFYARALSLPLFPAMTDDHVQRVIDTCADAVRGL
ncbi:MAG: UDP-4-amino-4,6-dideoxy-N-acetyl-beta-L-altrosamine transaminase [Planctomycetota bacterium]|jgi:UDP-4-amino-4,6-dideoxy-N-acetyl-beta-L-altrosamine transaminase